MTDPLRGVLPVLQTPFQEDDAIDWAVLDAEIDHAFQTGAQGVCTAMVSEYLKLSQTERRELNKHVAGQSQGRGAFVASVGAESTIEAVANARWAADAGATAVMAIPPTTEALPDQATLGHFHAIAAVVEIPLIVQDASGYVGKALAQSTCTTLLDTFGPDRIRFKPEANPIGPKLSALRNATGGRAKVYDGSGGILLVDSYRRGITGTMPGVEILPALVALWNALEAGNDDRAYLLSCPIASLITLQIQSGLDGFLAVEKYLLKRQGIFTNERRRAPTAFELDNETRAQVDRLYERLQAAQAAG